MRFVITIGLIIVAVAGAGCGEADAQAAPATRRATVDATIASYNVENYFDRYNDHYTEDETTEPKADDEQAELARAIDALDADFVAVTEMENEGELYRFRNRYLPDAGLDHVYVGHRDWGRGINNGALFAGDCGGVTIHRFEKLTVPGDDRQWTFARDVVEFDWRPADGVRIAVLVVHFKSKLDSRGDPDSVKWRLAEAMAVRRIVEEKFNRDPRALYAVVGDFNDTPGSPTLRALLAGDRRVLVDTMADVPLAKKVTYLKQPYRSTIDYVLVSPALSRYLVAGSAKVGTEHLGGSDHAPVMATFRLPTR